MTSRVAIVDDNVNLLRAMEWLIKDEPYKLYIFHSPIDALFKIEQEDFAVVVSDLSMPEMDGRYFFKLVTERHPDIVPIIITANDTYDISKLNIFKTIRKPWNNFEFIKTIQEAIDYY